MHIKLHYKSLNDGKYEKNEKSYIPVTQPNVSLKSGSEKISKSTTYPDGNIERILRDRIINTAKYAHSLSLSSPKSMGLDFNVVLL